jgi:hypothetical protein
MSLWARSDLAAVNVSVAHGGCGKTHHRPAPDGIPVQPWRLDCAGGCEDHLRHDSHWAVTPSEIPETHDEAKSREDFERRGAKDKDAVLTLALARLAGIETSELPESLTRMISGAPLHVPVQGQVECPQGHAQAPGKKFCGDCGSPMSGPAPKAALSAPERQPAQPAEPSAFRPKRLRDAPLSTLQGLAADRGLDASGTRADLIGRLADAGVTNAVLQRFLQPAAA